MPKRSARPLEPPGRRGYRRARRGPTEEASVLLPSGSRDEHAIDLVPRRLVLDAIGNAPDAPQPPLVQVGRVVKQESLRLGIDLDAFLLIERRAPGLYQVVQL